MKTMEITTSSLSIPNHYADGKFYNTFTGHRGPAGKDMANWVWNRWIMGNTPPDPGYPDSYNLKNHFDGKFLDPGENEIGITYIGHATTLIYFGKHIILTDPFFADRSSPVSFSGPKRIFPPAIPIDQIKESADIVLISHNHYDHMDLDAISELGNLKRYVLPLKNGKYLKKYKITNYTELDWGQYIEIDGLRITLLPARHFSSRNGYWDTDKSLWGSFMLEYKGRKIFFAGDTGYSEKLFQMIGSVYESVDLAVLPIGAYLPRSIMSRVHVNPEEAVRIMQDINAKMAVPIHWATIKLSDEPMMQPPSDLRLALKKQGIPEEKFPVLYHGQSIII